MGLAQTLRMEQDSTKTRIEARIRAIEEWLEETAPYARADQRHLDAYTPEQAYWHLGYQAALIDSLATFLEHDGEVGESD